MLHGIKRISNKSNIVMKNYKNFSLLNKIKRHFEALVEPDGSHNNTAIIDTNLSMYTNMRQFQAYLTKNAYDMSIMNEYDLWPHTNFGTIDNPSLIFSADASWRYGFIFFITFNTIFNFYLYFSKRKN